MTIFNVNDGEAILTCDAVTPSGTDVTVNTNVRYLRAGSAANLILRYPGSGGDVTINTSAGEYVPVSPGVIIRSTSTVSPILAFGR
jgi:hypothetical protein